MRVRIPIYIAVGLAAVAAPAGAQDIRVTVNGDPVAFAGQQPVQRAGSVLVPLRGVFEKLGANVQYDNATKTILASKGPTTVSLRLGQAVALVNGRERTLSAPAQASLGTTLVPLRFVSEALGAQVAWDAPARTVRIETGAATAADLPQLPAGEGPVTGTITGLFPEANNVTVRVTGGQNTRVPLAPDAVVLVQGAQGPAVSGSLQSLRVGDQITIRRRDAAGRATVLEAVYGERQGVVKSVQRLPSGNYLVTLADSSIVEVVPDAPVRMGNNPVALSDVKTGESVVIRLNPQTKQGIGIAVVTADNPQPTPPAKVEVFQIRHSAAGRPLRGGETLTVELRGTPGAQGAFSIPGVEGAQSLPLRETSPGLYTGTFTAPAGANIRGASVLASLDLGGTSSPVIQAGDELTVDAAGPVLGNLTPAGDAALPPGRPLIYGTYSDVGSGIATTGTRLVVNGRDVTADATITPAFFSYRPAADLPVGRNTVVAVVRDAAGNETRQEWAFTITAAQTPIRSLTVSPEGRTLGAGDVLTVRLEATPGGTARFSIGGAVTNRQMQDAGGGVYTGSYTVQRGDSLAQAPVTVTFTGANGQTVTQTAGQSLTIAAGAPNAPVIDAPQEGAAVGSEVTITGRAAPNATVRISVGYQGRLLIIGAQGTVATEEVRADAQGRWSSSAIRLDPPFGVSNLTYTVRATTVDAAGVESEPATVQFKR